MSMFAIIHLPPFLLAGVLIGLGFCMGKLARLVHLPSIIGYMAAGMFLGPSILNICSKGDIDNLDFITQMGLGFVAFAIGSELSIKALRSLGKSIGIIILTESFGAFIMVFLGLFLLTWNLPLALVFAAMAPASAPAGTVAVLREYRAKGKLTTALYAVVGFDDGLAIIIFAFAFTAAKTILQGRVSPVSDGALKTLWIPFKEIILSFIIGGGLGLVFSFLARKTKETSSLIILIFGTILFGCGLAELLHLSLILTNMMIGFVLVNLRKEDLIRKVADQMNQIMPLIFILFFSLAGAHLDLHAITALGIIGTIYIITRSAGLIGGAYIGGVIGKADKIIRKYLGLGILSQAGVAIGLALIAKSEFAGISPEAARIGSDVLVTVTATCILFEIVGPILTKVALKKAGEISP